MTTKVNVSVPPNASWRAKVVVAYEGTEPDVTYLDPHSERDFYVTSTATVSVSEEPLNAAEGDADGKH